jgi:hypothetical protein
MTATEWAFIVLTDLAPSKRYVYYRGYLARDRCFSAKVNAIAKAVQRSCQLGQVELTQRRLGFEEFEYIAIGRKPCVRS